MIGYYPINPGGPGAEEDAFGPAFFRTHFFDRMKQVCQIDNQTPVLELVLTTGQVVDVSHIVQVKADYMLVSAFVDARDCKFTYETYIRYQTIYRINVQTPGTETRAIGFTPHIPEEEEPAAVAAKAAGKKK
ncbi:MAG: hypothetical protein K8I27_08350 [Planctomycetes bacterium]|nr:hypothetical protein [Planctomycetota bacterium]